MHHPGLGYLCLRTVPDRPGVIQVLMRSTLPEGIPTPEDPELRYVARFTDVDAARMHAHEALHRGLLDVEQRLYRADLASAVAAVEADGLRHERIWIDPAAGPEVLARVEDEAEALRRSRERRNRMWTVLGWIGVVLLLGKTLGLF